MCPWYSSFDGFNLCVWSTENSEMEFEWTLITALYVSLVAESGP